MVAYWAYECCLFFPQFCDISIHLFEGGGKRNKNSWLCPIGSPLQVYVFSLQLDWRHPDSKIDCWSL